MSRFAFSDLTCLLVLAGLPLFAADVQKQDNADPLNAGSSWVGGAAPGAGDVAVWSSAVTGPNSSALTNAATWSGIKVTNPGGPVTITGSAVLSVTNVNMSSATQDLSLELPVTMGGIGTMTDVAAGRKVTFSGPLNLTTGGNWGRKGLGTVVLDGVVTSAVATTLELQTGTNVLSGKNGGLIFTSASNGGSRLYVGRSSGDATLIVSNGVHETRGVDDQANANMVGVGATGRVFIEGGSLRVVYLRQAINSGNGYLTVNGGSIEATGGGASGTASYAMMFGNQYQDGTTANNSSGTITINGGQAVFTNGIFKIGSKSAASTGSLAVNLNGGTLAVRQFYVDSCPLVPKTMNFNGGTLFASASTDLFTGPALTNGTLAVNVGDNGLNLDTGVNDVNVALPLLNAGSGGLTKLGNGTLTLAAANTYTGMTRVLAGTLRLTNAAALLHPNLAVASRAGLSLRNGTLANFSPAVLSMGNALAASTLELELAADSSACDKLVMPAGATLGLVAVAPVVQGSTARATRPGDYVIMSYAGVAPDVSKMSVLTPAPFRTYSFILDGVAKTVTLRIAFGAGESVWTAPGGGDWGTAGNWTVAPANAAGTRVRLADSVTAPATVTSSSPVTLGGLTFESANAYTLSGSGFTFDNGSAAPYLNAARGSHTVSAPLTLAGALSVNPTSSVAVTLSGAVSGSGSLVKDGPGDLILTQANTYGGGTLVKQGSVILADSATLGSGTITFNGGSGFRINSAAPLTMGNPLALAATATMNANSNDLALTGTVDWQASGVALIKSGAYELGLSGSGSETAISKFNIDNGTLRFKNGANFNLLSTAERDVIFMRANNTYNRSVVIDPGAQLTVCGIETEFGTTNMILVQGGSLTMLGGGLYDDVCTLRSNGSGVDRFVVNSGTVASGSGKWFNVGVRAADAYLTVNGGTTTLSRVSLGARENVLDLNAKGTVQVLGGLLEIPGTFNWMGSSTSGRTNTLVLGNGTAGVGTLRLCATENPAYTSPNTPIMMFNGGTLETLGLASFGSSSLTDYLYGAKLVYVGAGGARINTLGNSIAITQPLLAGTLSDGGLTKLGSGSLTLTGACSFVGATLVSGGKLTLPAVYASSNLTVSSGAELSLVNGSIQTLTLSAANLASGAKVSLEALPDASACDKIALPSGAAVGDLAISVFQAGTAAPASRPGDYVLFSFAGSAPSLTGWSLLNPPASRTWSFSVVGSTVVLHIAYASDISIWKTNGSGAWETAGNWTAAPADAVGAAVRFDDAITSPATVTRSAPSTVGSVSFNNAASYTLAGSALTLANTNDAPALIQAESGIHTLSAPLVLTSNALIRSAADAGVALNGGVSGSASLVVEGPGALALPNEAGLSVGGISLTAAARLIVSNTASVTTPISVGAGGGVVAPAAGQTLALGGAVTGGGSLTKEASSVLAMTNANASYSGVTKVKAGTVRVNAMPPGGVEFGQGTLHYVGGGETTSGGYTLDTGDNTRAGVLRADGDLTFQGNVSALSGAWVKTGTGTVTFTAAGLNVFNAGNGAGASHNVLNIGAYGDSPTTGFSGFNVVDGKVVIGAAGQTNLFNGLLVVGLNSTSNYNAETAGLLDVVGGTTVVGDSLIIGRSNGFTNTAPVARLSKLRMTAGDLSVGSLILGRALVSAGHNSASEADLAGGTLTSTGVVTVAEQAGAVSTLKLSGATLIAPNIARGGGQGSVIFNGGVFRPSMDNQAMTGLSSATVAAGGALFDLSQVGTYTLSQTLSTDGADGGLTKTGTGTLTLSAKQLYSGPTAVSQGALRIAVAGGLSNVTALTVSPGAALTLDTANTQIVTVAGLTLGAAAAAPTAVTMAFLADGSANDKILSGGPVSLGVVAFTLVRVGLNDAFGMNGTYTLMTYTGSDPSTLGLSVANPAYGKSYTFAAASGAVTVTIAADYTGANGGAIWNVDAGGNWSGAGNWVAAPGAGAPGQKVRFDDKITAPVTVAVDTAATVGTVFFNNTNAYALSGTGPLTLNNGVGTQAVVSVERGAHTIAAPVAVPDDGATLQVTTGNGLALTGAVSGNGPVTKVGGGDLTAGAPSTRTGPTEVQGGTLVLRDGGTVGSGELILNGAYGARVLGNAPSTLANQVTLKSAPVGTPIVRAEEQALTLSGKLDWQSGVGVVYKYGTNDLVLSGTGGSTSGSPKLYVREGGVRFAPGANYALSSATRETIKLGLTAGVKTALTIESGASLVAGGINVSAEAMGTAGNDALITQNGGLLDLRNTTADSTNAVMLRDWGTAPATYVMNGGTFVMPQASWVNVGNYGPGRITVNGGTMSLGRFAAGYQVTPNAANGGSTEVTVNGGRLEATGSWSWMSDSGARPTDVRVNGGTLALPATRTYGTNVNRWAGLTLNGGTLECLGAALDSSALDDYLAGVRRVSLDSAGGVIDTKGLNVTVRQNVLALSSTGGVTKIGGGVLTLAGTNVLWGLADVQEGTLRAKFAPRNLPGSPLFWFGMDNTANADLSGNGFALSVSNPGSFAATNRNGTSQALAFNGSGWFSAPHNPYFTNVVSFSVSAWILLTNSVSGSNCSILSCRPGGDRAFELKLMDGNLLRILQHSYASQAWWQEFRTVNAIPVGQWTHVAVTLTPQGVAMYLNGVRQQPIRQVLTNGGTVQDYAGGYYYSGDLRFMPCGRTGGLIIGRPTSVNGPGFAGAMDDFMLFERALSDAEVAMLYSEAPAKPVSVRVAGLGTLDLMGGTQTVSQASGSGQVINGTLAVKDRLAVGDSEAQAPGAFLSVSNLSLGTNVVYACSANGVINDLTDVAGQLTVDGAGLIDFGRTEANPIAGSFTATVMTYGTITGAANFNAWTVTGLGRRGYLATVKAQGGEVIVTLKSTFGTVLLMK